MPTIPWVASIVGIVQLKLASDSAIYSPIVASPNSTKLILIDVQSGNNWCSAIAIRDNSVVWICGINWIVYAIARTVILKFATSNCFSRLALLACSFDCSG